LRDAERRRFHDATHHVFAVRTLDGSLHMDDDGEPAGTAGRPVASALERADFRRAAVVVTRWFGGTKLGTGGLARAYGDAAAAVLERLTPAWAAPGRSVIVTFPYEETGAVMRVVEASRGVRSGEAWGEEATIRLLVPAAALEGLRRSLRDATAGRCHVRVGEETVLVPVPPVP
jgi:putative IMPACT (imprinted ancient) family translation regulator